jgi:hypothetical protein
MTLDASEDRTWVLALLAIAGASTVLIIAGAVIWWGPAARRLRLAGVALAIVAALGTVSFAFLLLPLILPGLVTLRLYPRRARHDGAMASPT